MNDAKRAMVCSANDFLEWKDFPKGLRVLLVDENTDSASEIRSKLEEMDYIVSTFCNENDALLALLNSAESFHVAIVEVSNEDGHGSFKFLETAKDLPTIMTSNGQCLSTMMKCIALGAVEFLHKPLSVDKLKNIWQHVVHKAFNAGGSLTTEKESFTSMLNLQVDNVTGSGGDKFPAPSTPQNKQGARLTDDSDFQDHAEKESGEEVGDSKSVETTVSKKLGVEVTVPVGLAQESGESVINEEDNSVDGCKSESNGGVQNSNPAKASNGHNSYGNKANRKKMKVDWAPELHKKFVHAVEQLGVDQAIPSRILELMKVDGLTRHNVASHLQKYRMHRRHILPKEDDRKWPNPRESIHKPIMAFPPYHGNQVYPIWGQPNAHPTGVPMWAPPTYPVWPQPENWPWQPYPTMQADAWGCPVIQPQHSPYSSYPQNLSGYPNVDAITNECGVPQRDSFDVLAEEEIDRVLKEAMRKPWMPLPLGLKPPSTDTVLAELSRQGISTIPPSFHHRR